MSVVHEKVTHEFVATGDLSVSVKGNEVIVWMEVDDRLTIEVWSGIGRPTVTFIPAPVKDYTKGGPDGST